MKKLTLLTLFTALCAPIANAQMEAPDAANAAVHAAVAAHTTAPAPEKPDSVKYWTHKGIAGINMSQVSLSNWAAGGDNSIAFDLSFAMDLNYKKNKSLWTNRLELAYGLADASSTGTRKTNDKIYLNSNYGYAIAKNWYASAFVTYATQFANGYNYSVSTTDIISKFMAPGYLTTGLGFVWTPKKWFKATLAPAAWKGTFVLDQTLSDAGAYGVKPGEKLLNEFGANTVFEVTYTFLPNMNLYSRLALYSNYLEKPQNVDVNWDTQINMKINKWFSANLGFTMIYDDNTKIGRSDGTSGPAIQIKELVGIGLQAQF